MNETPQTSILCTAMMRLGTRMAAVFDQHFAGFGVTQAQFRVLISIWPTGSEGIAPSALAKNLLLERATVSVLTQRMLERGLLERAPGHNRRSFRLRVTPEGETLLRTVIPHACALADRALTGNAPEEVQSALRFLERLEANLRAMPSPDNAVSDETKRES